MKLKDAIDLYAGKKRGEVKTAGGESFEELLETLTDEQDGTAEPSEAEISSEIAADESAAAPEKPRRVRRSEHKAAGRRENAFLRVLGGRRGTIIRLALAGLMLLVCEFVEIPSAAVFYMKIAAGVIVGYDLIIKAVSDVACLNFLGGVLPVLAAALIYLCIGRGTEAVIALIVYHVAVLAADYACGHIHNTCRKGFEPRLSGDAIEGENLDLGENMTCPADCIVIAGTGSADMSYITGDRTAVALAAGSFVPAGAVIVRGVMTAKVIAIAENSLVSVISRELLSGAHVKTQSAEKAASAGRAIVLSVLVIAAALMVVLPVVFHLPVTDSLARVACVIALAAPGSLLLSVPLTFFIGMTSARRIGVIFRKATDIECTAVIKSIAFDKVGSLTGRDYVVSEIATDKMDPATFLKVAAYALSGSEDPIARAIVAAYGKEISDSLIENRVYYAGRGVSVAVDGINILLGTQGFLAEQGISLPRVNTDSLAVHMTVNGIYAGRIALNDYVVPNANAAINRLSAAGVERFTMMSTDNRERDLQISKELGIDEYLAECPLSDRPRRVKEMKARIDPKCTMAYVSANLDAKECFTAADVGIALGAVDQPRLLEMTDVALMASSMDNIPTAIQISQGVCRFVRFELLFTIAAKLILLLLTGFGFIPLWITVLADGIASLGVILDCRSALRLGGNVGFGGFLR